MTPLQGITAALPDAEVSYSVGAVVQEGIAEFPLSAMTNPSTGEPGALVRFLDDGGAELFREDRRATALVWFGGDAPIAASSTLEFTTRYVPEADGSILVGIRRCRHRADLRRRRVGPRGHHGGGRHRSRCGIPVPAVEFGCACRRSRAIRSSSGSSGRSSTTDRCPARWRSTSASSRTSSDPGRADRRRGRVGGRRRRRGRRGRHELEGRIRGLRPDVARHCPAGRTIWSVRSPRRTRAPSWWSTPGAPVLLPWRDDVAAVLLTWFGGQQYGEALADVLLGAVEPGGRLPTTWPVAQIDVPVIDVTPVDGVVAYTEGIHIGYRAWLKAGTVPAYEFGHGLGYTELGADGASFERRNRRCRRRLSTVEVDVANTGDRAGKQVVQVYASRPDQLGGPAGALAGRLRPGHRRIGGECHRVDLGARPGRSRTGTTATGSTSLGNSPCTPVPPCPQRRCPPR